MMMYHLDFDLIFLLRDLQGRLPVGVVGVVRLAAVDLDDAGVKGKVPDLEV